jgi:hypothetical protein
MTTHSLHPVQTLLRPGALAHSLNSRYDKRSLLLVFLLVNLIFLVGWAHLRQQSQTAAMNTRIENYRDDIDRLNHINAILEAEIAAAGQLQTVAARAEALGFEPAGHNVYLLVPDYPLESAVSWQSAPLSRSH